MNSIRPLSPYSRIAKYRVYSSINLPKRPIITLVNLINTNWTGKAKLENSKTRVQVRGVDKTPFVARPTTIAKKGVKETVVLWDHIKAKETFHVVNQCIRKRTCLAIKA